MRDYLLDYCVIDLKPNRINHTFKFEEVRVTFTVAKWSCSSKDFSLRLATFKLGLFGREELRISLTNKGKDKINLFFEYYNKKTTAIKTVFVGEIEYGISYPVDIKCVNNVYTCTLYNIGKEVSNKIILDREFAIVKAFSPMVIAVDDYGAIGIKLEVNFVTNETNTLLDIR